MNTANASPLTEPEDMAQPELSDRQVVINAFQEAQTWLPRAEYLSMLKEHGLTEEDIPKPVAEVEHPADDPARLNTNALELKPSPIHGTGVFAKKKLYPGVKLSQYTGDKYTLREFKEKYGTNTQYCWVARRANYVVCAKEKRNLISYVNESKTPNVEIKRGFLVPLRTIEPNEELVLSYGKNYPRDYELE